MASIMTGIRLNDQFTGVLQNVISSVNMAVTSMERMQSAMNTDVSNESLRAARTYINQAVAASNNMRNSIQANTTEQQNFNNTLQNGTTHANSLMQKIKGFIGVYGMVAGAKSALNASDELTQTTARLNLMNDGMQSTQELTNMVYASAQDARGGFADMAGVVARFGNNAKDAFGSSKEVVQFANLIQKQMTISGASTQEASAAMLQLSQALGSGVLRGDELNSVFENAPNLIQNIADYLNVPIGKIRDMASEGEITSSIIKNAVFAASDQINQNFNNMPVTFGQIWTSFKNTALMAFQPVLKQMNDMANNPSFQAFVSNATTALTYVAGAVLSIFSAVASAGNFIHDNWDSISPIVYGAVAALTAYLIISRSVMAVDAVMSLYKSANAAASALATGATFAETAAQQGLNATMLACPVTWLVMAIIALVAVIFNVCQQIADLNGISTSTFGNICGCVNVVIQFFVNLVKNIANSALAIWGSLKALCSNIGIAFNNAISGVQAKWYSLLSTVTSVIAGICDAINNIPFVNIDTSGLNSAANEYANKAQNAANNKQEYQSVGAAFDKGMNTYDTFQDGWVSKAYKGGASWGDGLTSKLKSKLSSKATKVPDTSKYNFSGASGASDVANNTAQTAANTGKAADSANRAANAVEMSNEDLSYLRDIADRDIVNRFTTASIKVNAPVTASINKDMDIDGIAEHLRSTLEMQMNAAAEGVH